MEFRGPYWFLSNFYPANVVYKGETFRTSEHAYMSAKSDDPEWLETCLTIIRPGDIKRASRKINLRSDWEQVKLEVMEEVLRSKFSEAGLAKMLKATGNLELVETNTWGDRFWGVCNGTGENHLGKLLMKIRSSI